MPSKSIRNKFKWNLNQIKTKYSWKCLQNVGPFGLGLNVETLRQGQDGPTFADNIFKLGNWATMCDHMTWLCVITWPDCIMRVKTESDNPYLQGRNTSCDPHGSLAVDMQFSLYYPISNIYIWIMTHTNTAIWLEHSFLTPELINSLCPCDDSDIWDLFQYNTGLAVSHCPTARGK